MKKAANACERARIVALILMVGYIIGALLHFVQYITLSSHVWNAILCYWVNVFFHALCAICDDKALRQQRESIGDYAPKEEQKPEQSE